MDLNNDNNRTTSSTSHIVSIQVNISSYRLSQSLDVMGENMAELHGHTGRREGIQWPTPGRTKIYIDYLIVLSQI